MTRYAIIVAAALGLALTACGGQRQAESPAVDSGGPAGFAGPPPGAAPEPGVGDANTVATQPSPPVTSADVGAMGEGGAAQGGMTQADPTSGMGDQPQDALQQTGQAADTGTSGQQQPGSAPTQ